MHHFFYIQSGIALAIALKAIDQLKLEKEKCVFLMGRKTSAPEGFLSVNTEDWSFKTSLFFPVGWKNSLHTKKKIRAYLKEQGVTEYKFYTTSFAQWFCYVLMHEQGCKEVWALEEGRASFYSEQEFRDYVRRFHYSDNKYRIYQIKSWFNYLFQHYPNPNKTVDLLKKHAGALVTSLDSYEYVSNRIVIEDPFSRETSKYDEIECVMAFSYPVEDGLITIDKYIKVLEDSFEAMQALGLKKVHFKFHPQQMSVAANLQAYRDAQKKFSEIEFIELDREEILEVVMSNSKAILVSDYSSLMIYTKTFGNKMYSNFNLIEKHEPSIREKLAILPQVLLDLMTQNKLEKD